MTLRRCATHLLTSGLLVTLSSGAGAASPPWFVPGAVTAAGAHVVDVGVGDFNGDTRPDLAVASLGYKLQTVRVLLNRGGGAFTAQAPAKLSHAPVGILDGDLNGDGKLDAAVLLENDDESTLEHAQVEILLGNGAGALRRAPDSPFELGRPVAVADVNGDRKPDLVAVDDSNGRIDTSLGNGKGEFARPRTVGAGVGAAVADFNGDGQPDLVVGGEKNASILLAVGSGRFATAHKITSLAGALVAADFNGDGKADLAIAGKTLTVLLGDGAGGFARAGKPLACEVRVRLTTGDVNGDGRADVICGVSGAVAVLLADPSGRLHRVPASAPLPFSPAVAGVSDFTGDGKADLAVQASAHEDYGDVADEGEDRVAILAQASPVRAPSIASARARPSVEFPAGGAIARFAADGGNAAAMTIGGGPGTCTFGYRIVVWNVVTRKSTRLDRLPAPHCFPAARMDANLADFALGGDTVAWITASEAGNTEGYHDVFAARLPGEVKRIAAVSGRADYDAIGEWAGHLLGGGSLLAYNEWGTACEPPPETMCYSGENRLQVVGTRLVRVAAGRRSVVRRGAAAYRLESVGGRRMAVESLEDGMITVLARTGARVATVPAKGDLPLSAALGGTRLAVARWSGVLDLYDAGTGRRLRTLRVAAKAPTRLGGVNTRLALLHRSGRLVLVRLSDGREVELRHPPRLVGAALTERGLFYAYNAGHRGLIAFEANATLLRAF